jgi:hypothetical protein
MKQDDDSKASPFGSKSANRKEVGQRKYDTPSRPEEDTATDERRDKPIRGPEPHDDT